MKAGSAELKYLFAKNGVSEAIQAQFFHFKIQSVARFASFCSSEGDMRRILKDEMGLDEATNLLTRGEVAGVLVAFRAAGTRTAEMEKYAGEMDAKKLTRPLQGSEFQAMRTAFVLAHGPAEDSELPARVYLEKRCLL